MEMGERERGGCGREGKGKMGIYLELESIIQVKKDLSEQENSRNTSVHMLSLPYIGRYTVYTSVLETWDL